MQLESTATPARETPQQRYANLHRALERGLESDELWKDLAEVCLSLGHADEAVRCLRQIRGDAARLALESRLVRLGLVSAGSTPSPASAASLDADKPKRTSLAEHRLRDHVLDAFQYLFHQHMPLLVVLTTLAFPLVVGAGGFLTAGAGGSLLVLAAIAALPGLCVLGMVGAMGRQILLTSADGTGDVPPIPGFWQLVADARRFLADLVLVLGALLGPAFTALAVKAPIGTTLPALLVGAYFVPIAWVLRQMRCDFRALSPTMLLRAAARGGFAYTGLSAVTCALFAPAAAVAWIAFGRPIWVQIAIIGPLCVLPIYVASRLLGTWLDVHRHMLTGLVHRERRPAAAPVTTVRTTTNVTSATAVRKAPPRASAPRRPAGVENFTAPVAKSVAAGAAKAAPARRAAPPAQASPKRQAAPAARPAAPAAPAPVKSARAIEGRAPTRLNDQPDLASMPGAVVVSGDDRKRQGAAAKRP